MMSVYDHRTSETFEWVGSALSARVETGMSGMAYLSALQDAIVARPPLVALITAELLETARGRVQLICSASDSQFGVLHELDPATASLLLNAAVGCVAQTLLGLHEGWATVSSCVSYVRPVSPRVGTLMATAEVVDSRERAVLVKGELTDAGGQQVATITTTLDVIPL